MAWTGQTTGLVGLAQRYAVAAQSTGQAMARVMTARLAEATTYARATYRSAATTTETATAVRTGALRAALGSEVHVAGRTVTGTFGYLRGSVPYAAVHERLDGAAGTTIHPTHGQYLAIPLRAAKTAAGVVRGSPRDFPQTFVQRSKAGNLLIFERQGKRIVPLFLLTKEVYVPARPALQPTLARFLPAMAQDLTRAVTDALKG